MIIINNHNKIIKLKNSITKMLINKLANLRAQLIDIYIIMNLQKI